MRRLTASSLDAAAACIGSAVIDAGIDERGPYADGGKVAHRFLEHARVDREAALREVEDDEDRDFLGALDVSAIPLGLSSEVAVAYHPERDEGRILEGIRDRGYPEEPGWIYGTADLLGVAEVNGARRVYVPDLKRYQAPRRAKDSLQLKLYALGGGRALGAEEAETSFLVPRHDGRWYTDRAYLDALDLEEARLELIDLMHRRDAAAEDLAAGRPIRLDVGEQCTYCRARRVCPAQAGPLALAVAGDLEKLAEETLPAPEAVRARMESLAPEARGRLYQRAHHLSKFLSLVISTVKADAEQGPVPIDDDKELRKQPWGWKTVDSDAARAAEAKLDTELRASGERRQVRAYQTRVMARKGA